MWMLVLLLVLVACGSDEPTKPKIVDVSGTWEYAESISSSTAGLVCINQGFITVTQVGESFSGSYTQQGVCMDYSAVPSYNSDSGQIVGGQIKDMDISFSSGNCLYYGTLSGGSPNQVSGSLSCTLESEGQDHTFAGRWEATRQ